MFFNRFSLMCLLSNKSKSLRDLLGMSTCLNLSPIDNEVNLKPCDEFLMKEYNLFLHW